MNYRHAFHAANFADIVKHISLLAMIKCLSRKEKGFMAIDCFSGIGIYDLHSDFSARSPEYLDGIVKLWDYSKKHEIDELTAEYLATIKVITDDNQRFYPGSPFIITKTLREQDRAVFNELHPDDFRLLKDNIKEYARKCDLGRYFVGNVDGYHLLKEKLPPAERRGLIFIDPPFEKPEELDLALAGVEDGLKRFATGVYAIWLAIKDDNQNHHFLNRLRESDKEILYIEFKLCDFGNKSGLTKMGVAIVNPPFGLGEMLKPALKTLKKALKYDETTNFELKSL